MVDSLFVYLFIHSVLPKPLLYHLSQLYHFFLLYTGTASLPSVKSRDLSMIQLNSTSSILMFFTTTTTSTTTTISSSNNSISISYSNSNSNSNSNAYTNAYTNTTYYTNLN